MRPTLAVLFSLTTLLVAQGCDEDEVCGPVEGSASTLSAPIGETSVVWTDWHSSPNNDCGETGGPVSLTLDAQQMGSNFALTLCLPRPDKLSSTPVDIALESRVQIIDIFADVGPTCVASLDRSTAPSGTIAFPGICGNGDGEEGYSLELDFTVPMTVTCDGADPESEAMQFSGLVAIEAIQF
jgi:hypothetical protein